jgi:hypothetical protein
VVGTDKSVEAPPGVSVSRELFHEDVAVLETTLSGFACLSEHSARRSGAIGSPHPSTSFSRPRGLPPFGRPCGPKTARQLPQASPPSQGSGSRALPGPARPGRPSWGSLPSSDVSEGICITRADHGPAPSVLGVSHPLDGLLSLTPCGHARSAAAHGVLARKALSGARAETRCRASHVLSSTVLYSLEL